MPKTNDQTGATYAGSDDVVSHADGRLSQLNPEKNLDGEYIEGTRDEAKESEENSEDARTTTVFADADGQDESSTKTSAVESNKRADAASGKDDKGDSPSAGSNSETSDEKQKNSAKRK